MSYEPFASSHNIAGEIFGVLTALDWAVSSGYEKIRIYHDLDSISKWTTGEFKADSDIAKYYVKILEEKFNGCIEYKFVKVAGHSNNPYNSKADRLASSALKGERKMIEGANSFTVPNFDKNDLDIILQLIEEDCEGTKIERKEITGGEQISLKIRNKGTIIKMYNNHKLLVQGKPNAVYQMVFTYISELLGENKVVSLAKTAYRMKVNTNELDASYSNLCPNLPESYNSNIKTLLRQAIINLVGYFEAEDYGQYAFPALKAMEGHIKYLFGKCNINVGRHFEQFEGTQATGYRTKADLMVPTDKSSDIDECYNYYTSTRHQIFHFGDIIGTTDNTVMISSKNAADSIIREALRLINKTAY